jgi:hypothetical protein
VSWDALEGNGGDVNPGSGAGSSWMPSASTLTSLGTAAGDFGGLFQGFQQAKAYDAEANLYEMGASSARNSAMAAGEVGKIEEFQLQRKVGLSESATRAGAASNGLAESGSVGDILRESAMQGHQANQNIMYSTELKVDQFDEQAHAAEMQASAARTAASGAITGGIIKGITGVAQIASMMA